jgi:signal transduction histidine kinase
MIMWAFPVLGCALLASALLLRRRPLTALAVLLSGSAAAMALNPPVPASTLQIVAACAAGLELCYIAATRTRQVSVTGVAMAGAGLLILLLGVPSPGTHPGGIVAPAVAPVTIAVPLVMVMVIAWLIGNSIRQAHARAELVRAQAAVQTAMAERLRIARELHDIVAHSIGIIAIQAGSGRRVFDARPDQARDALATIEATSRETLSGLRRMVKGLRNADPEAGPGQAPLDPAPGLAGIDRLAAMTLDAGVQVDVDWHGSREPLPADIDASAFRIIQEAVTNVVRHAGTGQCQVCIGQQDGQLSIEVTDSGRGGSGAGTGYGITGMRERATLLGGDFSAGPRPGGGFRVTARLPLPAPAAAR